VPKFDYIIAGAGPAGSAIAYRLGQLYPTKFTLLIEAGDSSPVNVVVSFLK
jgi:flavin-dependent dehydrogenase